jgi:hypothetical protein
MNIAVASLRWDADKSVWVYWVDSGHQQGPNAIEILLPDDFDTQRPYHVLYVLPVEPGIGGRYGDGLQEVRRTNAHNRFGLICVQPAFDTWPWYADHATDATRRHESYIMEAVVPLVEERYPTLGASEGRLLLGFSKSGWGACTLLLRHPDLFGYAVSWDAPLMLDDWVPEWEMPAQFGTRENYQRYRPAALFETVAPHFRDRTRLALLGECHFGAEPYGAFRARHHTAWAHEEMTRLGIQHVFDDQLHGAHHWGSGWVSVAIEALMALVECRR